VNQEVPKKSFVEVERVVSNVIGYYRSNQEPVDNLEVFTNRSSSEFKFHVPTKDLEVNEFTFIHGESVYYVGMKMISKEILNQIGFKVLEFNRKSKQGFELHLNRGRLFYSKNGLFGVNESSSYQFDSRVIKLAAITYPRGLHQIQLSQHRAPGSESWSMESIFLGRWITSIDI
jgi:hypothetical protein